MKKLNELKKEQIAVIASVNGDTRFASRITSIGITPGCKAHSGKSGSSPCKGCLPEGGFKNMGEMWEVV